MLLSWAARPSSARVVMLDRSWGSRGLTPMISEPVSWALFLERAFRASYIFCKGQTLTVRAQKDAKPVDARIEVGAVSLTRSGQPDSANVTQQRESIKRSHRVKGNSTKSLTHCTMKSSPHAVDIDF